MKISELFVRLSVDNSGLRKGMKEAELSMAGLGRAATRLGGLLGAGMLGRRFIQNTIDGQREMAQLAAVLKSTGGAAGVSIGQLDAMSKALQSTSTFSDGAVQSAQALLLTFTQIKGPQFEGATRAVLDLATAMGGDLNGAAIQVGKALNDPVRGLTALRKAGIQFTESQTATIKKLVETGQIAEAQRVILKELEVQFGGSAAAARNTLGGALAYLKNRFDEVFESSQSSTTGIVGALNTMGDALPRIRSLFGAFFGGVEMMLVDLAITWELNFVKMRDVAGNIFGAIAGVMQKSYIPAIREAGVALENHANGLKENAAQTRSALEAWRAEQYNLIAGLNATPPAIKTVTTATDGLTTSTAKATAAAKALADTLKGIGNINIEGAVARAAAARREAATVPGNSEALAATLGATTQGFIDAKTARDAQSPKQTLAGRIGQDLAFTEMGRMAQAFAQFGPMAALLPVINGAMEKLGPAFTKLIEPLVSLGATIGEMLAPVFEMLAPVVALVAASFKVFQPVLRAVVIAFSYLMEGLGYVVKGLGKLIDALPFVSAKGIIRIGEDMIEAAKAARRNTDATDEATEAIERFASALSNIPRVLNINALRHAITGSGGGGGGGDGGGGGGGGTTGGGGGGVGSSPNGPRGGPNAPEVAYNITGPITVVADDPEAFLEKLGRVAERQVSRGGTPRIAFAI